MGRHDWYRNVDWNPQIEAAFRAKLSRARKRVQYLKIQAGTLARRHPQVALDLIDEYFGLNDDLWISEAHCIRARAFEAMGKWPEAVSAYKYALAREQVFPNVISNAHLEYPKLVALRQIRGEYADALRVLEQHAQKSDALFYTALYAWNGSYALIYDDLGRTADARLFAEAALAAASETRSPMRYHPDVGLVRDTADEFGRRVKRIASPSAVRSFFD